MLRSLLPQTLRSPAPWMGGRRHEQDPWAVCKWRLEKEAKWLSDRQQRCYIRQGAGLGREQCPWLGRHGADLRQLGATAKCPQWSSNACFRKTALTAREGLLPRKASTTGQRSRECRSSDSRSYRFPAWVTHTQESGTGRTEWRHCEDHGETTGRCPARRRGKASPQCIGLASRLLLPCAPDPRGSHLLEPPSREWPGCHSKSAVPQAQEGS